VTSSLPTPAIDALVAGVRSRISVLDPIEAAARRTNGALFIDTRPVAQRVQFGGIPGAIVIERNVLEWRIDPTSDHRHPAVASHVGDLVVFCQQGYASSLAVGTLSDLGVPSVHDLAGGFAAWAAAGLPVERQGWR
jgi:rhodanese-related sulfurtransferase